MSDDPMRGLVADVAHSRDREPRLRDSEHGALLGALKAAVPVLEAAIAHVELHDGPPSALVEAVRAFGGDGLHGIERADWHLSEVRALIDLIETRAAVDAAEPAKEP